MSLFCVFLWVSGVGGVVAERQTNWYPQLKNTLQKAMRCVALIVESLSTIVKLVFALF